MPLSERHVAGDRSRTGKECQCGISGARSRVRLRTDLALRFTRIALDPCGSAWPARRAPRKGPPPDSQEPRGGLRERRCTGFCGAPYSITSSARARSVGENREAGEHPASQCRHSVGCRIDGLAKKGVVPWHHISSLPVTSSSFSAAFLSLERYQASTQSCARCLKGLTACNTRCKATGSRMDVLPQSINSFRPYR
jgi:hypothetical protein